MTKGRSFRGNAQIHNAARKTPVTGRAKTLLRERPRTLPCRIDERPRGGIRREYQKRVSVTPKKRVRISMGCHQTEEKIRDVPASGLPRVLNEDKRVTERAHGP